MKKFIFFLWFCSLKGSSWNPNSFSMALVWKPPFGPVMCVLCLWWCLTQVKSLYSDLNLEFLRSVAFRSSSAGQIASPQAETEALSQAFSQHRKWNLISPRSFIWAQHQSAGCRGIKALIFDIVRVICIHENWENIFFSLMFAQTSSIVPTWHEHKLRFNVKSRPRHNITVYLNCREFL